MQSLPPEPPALGQRSVPARDEHADLPWSPIQMSAMVQWGLQVAHRLYPDRVPAGLGFSSPRTELRSHQRAGVQIHTAAFPSRGDSPSVRSTFAAPAPEQTAKEVSTSSGPCCARALPAGPRTAADVEWTRGWAVPGRGEPPSR
jgi:hypothetical protein